ncbi:MAG TPA: PAS domain S-box protein [Spirochaetota bacterium]|nr:PAS domain S-box protein [Spirochaetota bacterium]
MDNKSLQSMSKEELIALIEELKPECLLIPDQNNDFRVNYLTLVEAASDILFVLDREGNLMYRNSAWEQLFPYSDELIGKHFTTYLPQLEVERANAVFNAVLKDGQHIKNEIMKTIDKDEKTAYYLINFSPIRGEDGNTKGLFGIMRNITEMHLMEKRLRDNTRRLEEKVKEQLNQSEELKQVQAVNDEIINNVPIGIFSMDPTGIMLSENPALKRFMGHRPTETRVGVNLLQYEGFKQSGLDKTFEEVILTKKPITMRNVKYIPISGDRLLTINVRMDPILDNQNKIKNVLVIVEDATEQAQIASNMQKAERLSAMGLLAAGVAYELKVPLNLMTVNVNFIEKNINPDSPMVEYVHSLKDELLRVRNITDQLLNLAKPAEHDKETFEVDKLVSSHPIQITLNRLRENGYDVVTNVPEDLPFIRATKTQLVQVLLHLISNAEDAMPDKGRLTISAGAEEHDGELMASVTVEDTGIGIPEENLSKVFQPFFSTKGQKSTGLGLMVTYSIIENHEGLIGVKSRAGEGTAIRILLPAVTPDGEV